MLVAAGADSSGRATYAGGPASEVARTVAETAHRTLFGSRGGSMERSDRARPAFLLHVSLPVPPRESPRADRCRGISPGAPAPSSGGDRKTGRGVNAVRRTVLLQIVDWGTTQLPERVSLAKESAPRGPGRP